MVEQTSGSAGKLLQLFIKEKSIGLTFLVDSGAEVSVLPSWFINKPQTQIMYDLAAANDSMIKTTGIYQILVDTGLSKKYVWTFIVVEMENPILGADLLKANIILDLNRECLIDGETLCSTKGEIREVSEPTNNIHLITTQNIHQTVANHYPLPNLHYSISNLFGKTVFSYIDLNRTFHNRPFPRAVMS